MSYRSLFDATITADPPPSKTTVDTVIARARRRLRLRRLAVTAGGLAVAAVATAGGFAVTSGPAPSLGPVGTLPPSTTAPAPISTTLLGVEPTEPAAQAIARLESGIPGAILDAVPGIDLGGPVTVERRNVPSSETDDGGMFPATFFYETQAVPIRVAGKRADLSVTLMRRFVDSRCTPQGEGSQAQALLPTPDPVTEVSCEVRFGPHGERAVIERLDGDRAGIWLDRPDGSSIGVSEESTTDPLLTDDDLMAIALDPRVSFYR
ncbi:MAG TPA: hypothetical protein VGP16_11350 [Asanoa sp.]|nr:hypothetical protein [Asanoa sp.]